MILVDSSVWIDFFRGAMSAQTVWLNAELTRTFLGIPDLVLMKMLQGTRTDRDFARVHRELTSWCTISDTGGSRLAIASARNYRSLRARGLTVRKPVDVLIATFCIISGYSLLHRDRDFDAFEQHLGLQVVQPIRH